MEFGPLLPHEPSMIIGVLVVVVPLALAFTVGVLVGQAREHRIARRRRHELGPGHAQSHPLPEPEGFVA